jgi:hypothetical protein
LKEKESEKVAEQRTKRKAKGRRPPGREMSLSFLFGKTVKPEEVVRKWQRELRKEERNIERSIRGSLSPSICSLCL